METKDGSSESAEELLEFRIGMGSWDLLFVSTGALKSLKKTLRLADGLACLTTE